jgi:hypothetical protein
LELEAIECYALLFFIKIREFTAKVVLVVVVNKYAGKLLLYEQLQVEMSVSFGVVNVLHEWRQPLAGASRQCLPTQASKLSDIYL